MFRAVVVCCCLPGLVLAADQWTRIQSANFELFTTAGEKKGLEAVLYFEQVRQLFANVSASKKAPTLPVRIIAFRSDKEFEPYRVNEFAAAYYLGGHDRNYIVMKSIASEHYPVAIHEYVHLIVRHSAPGLPPWLNEGIADLYSTLRPRGAKTVVGDLLPGRVQTLATQKWLTLDQLAAVDHASPYYNEKSKAGIFYAESWALTHMLALSQQYRPKFPQFLQAIASGATAAAAFEQHYGKTLPEVQRDLSAYLRGSTFYAAVLEVKLEKAAMSPEMEPATNLESGLVLADLLSHTRKRDEARAMYEQLARDYPASADPEVGLGYLVRRENADEARRHWARAAERGSSNPQFYVDYAMLQENGQDREPLLRKALELKPDFSEARLHLAYALMDLRKYRDALTELGKTKSIPEQRASAFFRAWAYAHFNVGELKEAKIAAERALQYTRDPSEISSIENIMRAIDARAEPPRKEGPRVSITPRVERTAPAEEPPRLARRAQPESEFREGFIEGSPFKKPDLSRAEGTLKRVECLGKTARVHIVSAGKALAFLIEDPNKIEVRNAGGITYEFTCGPQKPAPIAVEFVPADGKTGVTGVVHALEFGKKD